LDAKTTLGILPFDRAIDTSDHTGAAFQATGEFDGHLSFLRERVEVRRAGIDTEPFLAGFADLLVEMDVAFLIVFKGIKGQLFRNLH
jgi:hypothetical protein